MVLAGMLQIPMKHRAIFASVQTRDNSVNVPYEVGLEKFQP